MPAWWAPWRRSADENLSFGAPLGMGPNEDDYALGFQAKVDAPGLKWICRDIMDEERPHFDRPLSGRFEEMDCIAMFENVLIPWEDVFVCQGHRDPQRFAGEMRFMQSLGHHVLVKNVAKTRFLFGLAHLLAESTKISTFINVQDRLGDILMWLQTFESLAIAAVEGAEFNPANGLYYPNTAADQRFAAALPRGLPPHHRPPVPARWRRLCVDPPGGHARPGRAGDRQVLQGCLDRRQGQGCSCSAWRGT